MAAADLVAQLGRRTTVAQRMGMYDTVHTGRRCGQVKIWDSALEHLFIGDEMPAVRDRYAEQRRIRPDSTYTVSMHGDGWLHIEAGVLTAWADEPGRGPRLPSDATSPARPPDDVTANGYWRVTDGECEICDQLRHGIAPRPPRRRLDSGTHPGEPADVERHDEQAAHTAPI